MDIVIHVCLVVMLLVVAHGTFVGTMRLEIRKPTQLPLDTTISFGASTRSYTLRERPQVSLNMATDSEGAMLEEGEGGTLLGLQDLDNEIDVRKVEDLDGLVIVLYCYCIHSSGLTS